MSASKIVLHILNVCVTMLCMVLIFFGLMKLGAEAYDFGYRIFSEHAVDIAPGRDMSVEIEEDMSAKDIGRVLEKKGLVKDKNLFVVQMKLSAYANKVKPGLYKLNTSQTAREMLMVMSEEKKSYAEESNR